MRLDTKPLQEAIDRYLAKADEDLEALLSDEGFVEAAAAVKAVERIEDVVVDLTQMHFDEVVEMVSTEEGLKKLVEMTVPEYESIQQLQDDLQRVFRNEFDRMVRQISFSFLLDQDPGLDVVDQTITAQTQDQITQWSRNLAASTHKWVEPKVMDMIKEEVKNGGTVESVTKMLYDSGIRDTEWKARRLALTEVLRMESMGQQESFYQNPACYKKKWVYTWQAKEPRTNHIDMNGQEVFKRETFTLVGKDGAIYHPLYPRDTSLPAGESINCHCIMSDISDKNILGLSDEERSEMRRQALEDADKEWEAEHAHDMVDSYKTMDYDDKVRAFGGKGKGEPYVSLIDSGVIQNDDQLGRLYKYDTSGRRHLKELTELNADGIYTVDSKAIKHATEGNWSNLKNPNRAPGRYGKNLEKDNGGNMRSGGHAYRTIAELESKGFRYNINKTYPNGVSIGGYDGADAPMKKLNGSGMSWFPKEWDDVKIRDAGTFVANRYAVCDEKIKNGQPIGYEMFANYEGVTVGIRTDLLRNPQTIYPDERQRLLGGNDD